jgi:hypothetical protein
VVASEARRLFRNHNGSFGNSAAIDTPPHPNDESARKFSLFCVQWLS